MNFEDGTYQESNASGTGTTQLLSFLVSPNEDSDGVAEVLVTGRSSGDAPYAERIEVPFSKTDDELTLGTPVTIGVPLKGSGLTLSSVSLAENGANLVVNWNGGTLGPSVSLGVKVSLRGRSIS